MDDELARRLRSIEDKVDAIRTRDLPDLRVHVATEISALKVKAGAWGAAAGILVSLGALLLSLALHR